MNHNSFYAKKNLLHAMIFRKKIGEKVIGIDEILQIIQYLRLTKIEFNQLKINNINNAVTISEPDNYQLENELKYICKFIDDESKKNKQYLRSGITASSQDILIACEMYEQGWTYTMPQPKSAKAGWGITDGRTTWYNGWWYNVKTGLYSDTTPQKSSSGLYLGDNQNNSNTWRKGGSPGRPDIYMYFLSKHGGPR